MTGELYELDEAAKTLEPNDAKEVDKSREQHESRKQAFDNLCARYRERRATARPVGGKHSSTTRSRGGSASKPTRLPENGRIAHSEGKRFLPSGAFLLKSRGDKAWKSRMPPFKEVSRSWHKHGEEQALFLVILDAWQKWCVVEGVSEAACPMLGVFPGTSGGAAASSSSAA